MIKVEPKAVVEFQKRLITRGSGSIRLGVKGGGCNGFSFSIAFDDNQPRANDVCWDVDDVSFCIDPKSMLILTGSTVVWNESPTGRGFDIVNPREASRCGCGRTFSVK